MIVRPLSVTLVESVKKKAPFCGMSARPLPLTGYEVLDMGPIELPRVQRSTFDVVTASAFADMGSALAAGVPLSENRRYDGAEQGPGGDDRQSRK